jgi:hypothetical protein
MTSHQLQTVPITLPFSPWRLDLVGPFKKAKGGFTHIFIAVDKFTKWIEVKHEVSITTAKVVQFIKEIMYMFGVPNNIITDNETQFTVRSKTFVRTRASRLTMLRCHTRKVTVKWSTQTT